MMQFNYITIIIAVVSCGIVLWLIRRRHLGVYHTLWWLAAVTSLLLLGFFPSIVDWFGHLLGIHYPPILPIIVAVCILIIKILTMDIERNSQEARIRILAQKMAAYEAELQRIKGFKNADEED